MARAAALAMMAALTGMALAACVLAAPIQVQAALKPTLELRQADGGLVAYQSGQPVPDFGLQPRPRLELDGVWRFRPQVLEDALTFGDRQVVVSALARESGGALAPRYDDSAWSTLGVPGTFTPPPASDTTGGWYRRSFIVPASFPDRATLKVASADYIADIWLNGSWLGVHEGENTPFAFDVGKQLRRDGPNVIVARVSRPALGSRLDMVPWGLTDWWEYAGLTGNMWIEGEAPLEIVRAAVTPHLDAGDISVTISNSTPALEQAVLRLQILPAAVTLANLQDPDPRSLVALGAAPLLDRNVDIGAVDVNAVRRIDYPFAVRSADLWSPGRPALYVLHASVMAGETVLNDFYDTFGLRQVQVDAKAPRLLLNGDRVAFQGVAIHDERVGPPLQAGTPAGGPAVTAADYLARLSEAEAVNANLLRADHNPPNPLLLMLADRLGFAVWEEIPNYHATPATFQISMQRGIPQQLLAEMDLRDQDHPSVLFHGLANESEGQAERVSALTTLRDLDRRLDGSRLTGQAAYGNDLADTSSDPLDVAGYTFYSGVFYDRPLSPTTIRSSLERMHGAYPKKPIMIMEFGRWADSPAEEPLQADVFQVTYGQMQQVLDDRGGYLGAAVWWALDDYWTERRGIKVEHFGLFRPDGSQRAAAAAAAAAFAATTDQPGPAGSRTVVSGGQAIPLGPSGERPELRLLLLYALAFPSLLLVAALALLLRGRGAPR
ncbi:MAG: hypothetical protein M3024_16260 [Candidatus Dormibacteraeota bacterium]|nr:hypothetical protein [Candidatus Dormibacteraeota bacterium]